MKGIGGYFGLELNNTGEFHGDALKLNTGRNALEYILRAKGYKKLFLPFFTCDVLLEPLKKLNMAYEFYSINENFEPKFDYGQIESQDAFLYINYFGLKDSFVKELTQHCANLIIDNSLSFYTAPIKNIDTFYSPRKYFGVADGAYLYCDKVLSKTLEQDYSFDRFNHLLLRIDKGPEFGYPYFVANNDSLKMQSIKTMSNLTQSILANVDYEKSKEIRKTNFNFLHKALKHSNKLNINDLEVNAPMIYPYWSKNKELRKRLLLDKIYIPVYWESVQNYSAPESLEVQFTNEITYLPIDQRYSVKHLATILEKIKVYER